MSSDSDEVERLRERIAELEGESAFRMWCSHCRVMTPAIKSWQTDVARWRIFPRAVNCGVCGMGYPRVTTRQSLRAPKPEDSRSLPAKRLANRMYREIWGELDPDAFGYTERGCPWPVE